MLFLYIYELEGILEFLVNGQKPMSAICRWGRGEEGIYYIRSICVYKVDTNGYVDTIHLIKIRVFFKTEEDTKIFPKNK